MKKRLYIFGLLLTATTFSFGQANTSLSNLTSPTSVNQTLIPSSNNKRDLGTSSRSWRVLFIDSAIYLKDKIFMHSAGVSNAFGGYQAGVSITSGVQNAAFGFNALTTNTIGSQNTAMGKAALYLNVDGSFNSGCGYQALYNNTGGNYNTASGAYSLFINNNGSYNTATGYNALRVNSTGGYNTALGTSAGYNNSQGGYNVFIGSNAGYNNINGLNNVFIGYNANSTTDVSNSVAIGSGVSVIKSNTIILGTDPNQQVGIGSNNPSAKLYVISQNQTTATYSASNAPSGYGVYGQGNATNSTGVLGQADNGTLAYGIWGKSASGNGVVGQGNNYGVWGVASAPGFAGYFTGNVNVTGTLTSASDQKLKENIKPLDKILDKIMLLKPSSYNFKNEYNSMNLAKGEQVGFIAQDLEKVFPQLVKTITDMQPDTKKISEYKAVNYISLIPLLTKAIQEQQEEISELKQMVNALTINQNNNSTAIMLPDASNSYLGQNMPNPSANSTTIQYTIAANFKSAYIVITNLNGIVLKQLQLKNKGKGTIEINTSAFTSGTYNYSLVVNGNTIDTKKMIVN